MRRTLWIVTLLLLLAGLVWAVMLRMPGTSASGSPPPITATEATVREQLRSTVTVLATRIGERNPAHPDALSAAAAYLEGELRSTGYDVELQDFDPAAGRSRNLIAERKGTRLPAEIVVVGAHYDSREGTPGADDNASGTAALLSLARTFANVSPGRTIRFVFFTNEEYFRQDLMGSVVYAKRCRDGNENVVAMVSLETIGHYSDVNGSQRYPFPINLFYPSTGDFLGFVGNIRSGSLVRSALASFRSATVVPSQGVAAPESIEGVGWSDQWSFWKYGYPGIMITDTAPFRNPNYHKSTDTTDTLNYTTLARVVTGLEKVVKDLGGI